MRYISFLLFVVCFSIPTFPAVAALGIEESNKIGITEVAQDIEMQLKDLPEAHFLSQEEVHQLDLLLSNVLAEQATQIEVFAQALQLYRLNKTDKPELQEIELAYNSALSLSKSKQRLLELSSPKTRELVVGFGPDGVTQFKAELLLTRLNLEYYLYQEVRTFKRFITVLQISPVPVLMVFFKIFIILILLRWWLKNAERLINLAREKMNQNAVKVNMFVRLFWYFGRAQRAIAWLITITLSLRVIAQLPSLQHLVFLEIFTWWILGGSIAVSFIIEFAFQHSRGLSKEIIRLRLSTIRLYVWGFIFTGLISQISAMTLGKATIYSWISTVISLFYILITIYSLHKWKSYIFDSVKENTAQPLIVEWAINNKNRWIFATVCTAIVALWHVFRGLQHYFMDILSQYQIVSHAMVYLFRIEVAKQTENDNTLTDLEQIRGSDTFNFVRPGQENSELISDYASKELQQIEHYLHSDKPAVCVISGERGIGTTTFLRRILHEVKNAIPILIDCSHAGYDSLLAELATQLKIQESPSEQAILNALSESESCYLIAFDNVQRLIKPQVGGLVELMALTNLMRQTYKSHRIVFAIEKSCWR
ncbi:MAG: ATP-binding protein, partial [Psychromonas sp.]